MSNSWQFVVINTFAEEFIVVRHSDENGETYSYEVLPKGSSESFHLKKGDYLEVVISYILKPRPVAHTWVTYNKSLGDENVLIENLSASHPIRDSYSSSGRDRRRFGIYKSEGSRWYLRIKNPWKDSRDDKPSGNVTVGDDNQP